MDFASIGEDIRLHPKIAIGAILVVAAIWIWSKSRGASGSTTTPASAVTPIVQTLPVDQNGNVIQPVGTTTQYNSYPTSFVPGPKGDTGATGATGAPGITPPPVQLPPPPGPTVYKHPAASSPTNGYSTNFWVYTSKSTDTLKYINDQIGKWGTHPPSFFANYRNNAEILSSYGIDASNYSKALPAGIQFSV